MEQLVLAGVAARVLGRLCRRAGRRGRRPPGASRPPTHYISPCDIDALAFSSGIREMTASVVSSKPAIDAAFCRAERYDLRRIDHAGVDEIS